MRLALAVATTFSAATLLHAQAPTPSPAPTAPAASPAAAPAPAAPAPSPAPELQKLSFLAGDWIHEETYGGGPMGAGAGKARSKAAWALGNHHLYVIYAAKSATAQLEGRAFLGWDPAKKQYRMHWFDSLGDVSVYSGNFDASGALVLTGEAMMDGRAVREQFTIKPQPDGKVVFTSAVAGEGGAMKTMLESIAAAEKK
jgi:hypothetical protein